MNLETRICFLYKIWREYRKVERALVAIKGDKWMMFHKPWGIWYDAAIQMKLVLNNKKNICSSCSLIIPLLIVVFGQIKWKGPLFQFIEEKNIVLRIERCYHQYQNPTIVHDFNDDVFKSFPNIPKAYPHWRKNMIRLLFFKNCLSYHFTILVITILFTFVLVVISTICIAFILLSFGLVQKSGHIIFLLLYISHLQLEGPHCLPHIAGKVSWTKKKFRK